MTLKIGINGFGRIGRCVARLIFENNYDLKLVQINAPSKIEDYAHLLKYDSVHGKFSKEVQVQDSKFIIDGNEVRKTSEKKIEEINWDDVDIVFECSGEFNNKENLLGHIKENVKKVLVSAPCKNADSTIVYGVNHQNLEKEHKVISIGSCTTNALAPIANILDKNFGIEKGFMTTIHAYTNDQRVLDGSHSDLRRARACNLSMIPTTTGAANAIGEVLPLLAGKLSGRAIRVPIPNVSLIDLSFLSKTHTSKEEINKIMNNAYKEDKYKILGFLNEELVSIDMNHNSYSCIFDPFETSVTGNNFIRVLSWYDNEWGYSNRMIDVALLLKQKFFI